MTTKPISILIVEDDLSICEVLKDIFSEEGHQVHISHNGKEALDYLNIAPANPDLILLDSQMPTMSGIEFKKTQMSDPRYAKIPVVLMSGDSHTEDELKSFQFFKILRKPVDIQKLFDLLESIQ